MAAFDILPWCVLINRSTSHLKGSLVEYAMLDTDLGYPVGFPSGLLFWMKGIQGHPWDIEVYNGTGIYHYITEDGDAVDQPICQAANGTPCWSYLPAYKRFPTPVQILPRMYDPALAPYTIDTPGPNTFHRTTDCEATYTPINLGDVRAVTLPIQNINWGGNIGTVPTIQNDYYYGGTIASGTFIDKESTFYVQNVGRVAWKYYKLSGGTYNFVQQSINNNIVPGGAPTPQFCSWSFAGSPNPSQPPVNWGGGTNGFFNLCG